MMLFRALGMVVWWQLVLLAVGVVLLALCARARRVERDRADRAAWLRMPGAVR